MLISFWKKKTVETVAKMHPISTGRWLCWKKYKFVLLKIRALTFGAEFRVWFVIDNTETILYLYHFYKITNHFLWLSQILVNATMVHFLLDVWRKIKYFKSYLLKFTEYFGIVEYMKMEILKTKVVWINKLITFLFISILLTLKLFLKNCEIKNVIILQSIFVRDRGV